MSHAIHPVIRTSAALAVAFTLCAGGSALAQQKGAALRAACKDDYKSVCSGVQPGGGRIMDCLRQNFDKLSPGCQQALKDAKAARKSRSAAQ